PPHPPPTSPPDALPILIAATKCPATPLASTTSSAPTLGPAVMFSVGLVSSNVSDSGEDVLAEATTWSLSPSVAVTVATTLTSPRSEEETSELQSLAYLV